MSLWTSQVVLLPVQEIKETWVQSLGQEDALEKEMATHFSILAWTEEPSRLWGCKQLDTIEWLCTTTFSSVAQSCLTLCDPMDCSTPGFPVHHQLPEPTQIHAHRVHDAIQPISSSVVPFSSHLQSFPASGSFQTSQLFASGGQSIGVSASTSVLPVNSQDWSPLGWTGTQP